MKQTFLCVLLVCVWPFLPLHAADTVATNVAASPLALSLADAKAMALHDHPSLEAMRQRAIAAAAAIRIARSAYWPTLDADAGVTRVQRHSYTGFPQSFVNLVDITPYTTYATDVTAEWLIFDGFRREFDVLASQQNETASRAALTDARRLLLQAVSVAYCQVLLARENMRIAQDDAAFSDVLLTDARQRFAVGVAPRSDVLTFENRHDQATAQRVEADKASRTARAALAEWLALPSGEVGEEVTFALPTNALAATPAPESALADALRHRPDLLAADAQAQAADAQRRSADAAWWPRVSAVGQAGLAHDQNLEINRERDANLAVGVQATWNLSSGGRDTAAREAAAAQARAAQQMKSALALKIAAEVRQNLAAIDASRQQLELQTAILARARQIRDLVRQEYVAGTTGITRMNEAQNETVRADVSQVIARIDCFLNRENLDAAIGLMTLP